MRLTGNEIEMGAAAPNLPHTAFEQSPKSLMFKEQAIAEFESTLQGHEACDLTVSPYRITIKTEGL